MADPACPPAPPAVDGAGPLQRLRAACDAKELSSADDRAAVLDWRLDDTRLHNTAGLLPWLPGIPTHIASDPDWGPYLAARVRIDNQPC